MIWLPDHVTSHRYNRNSNAALLLTLFVLVSPLLRYSYKKMGGIPPVGIDDTSNTGFSLSGLSQNGTHRLKPVLLGPQKFNCVTPHNPQCFLSLTDYPAYVPKKDPNVFYHLQTTPPVTPSVFYHLRKKGVGGRESGTDRAHP
jgi:hypothetical protein